ncbi:hypothetical protein PM082_004304 [Marasmius tenuissimus]|nr:hypothetical protein PM082_004304 [Marasmius tenuissimus]
MAAGKRRRTGVDSFLDVAAVEDGNDEDEVELEVEERFEVSDNDNDNDSTSARKQVTPEAHEDQRAFINALCDDLTARYVRDPKPDERPSPRPQTPLFLPSSSESPMPTYPSITRLREYVGPLEWVTVCSGTYRGDVGIAILLPRDDEDDEEDREQEEILQNKLEYNPVKKWRLKQEKDIEQMRAEQRELIHKLRHKKRGVDFLELEDLRCKHDEFQVLLVPWHPLSEREKSELQQEDPDIIRPFASETDGSSVHRNPPRLFNAKEYDNVEKVKVRELKLYRYNNSMFVPEGLLITNYNRKDLLLATSIPLKLEKAFRELNKPQTAIVSTKVDTEQVLKSIVGPVDYANETPEGRFLRERKEEETRREQRKLQEVVSKGEHAAEVRHLLKPHKKDDWVIIVTGKDRGKHGCVLARYQDIITVIIPEYHIFTTCHVNAAKRIPSPVERDTCLDVFGMRRELVPVPWVGIEVWVTRGPQSGCIGCVEMVERVEGRFRRRLIVGLWVDALKKMVLADHDHILTTLRAQHLRDAQPLSERQNVIYGISRSLLTGRELWLGTRVRITKGQLKGQLGLVRGVNVTFKTNKLQKDWHVLGKAVSHHKGIQLKIELKTQMAVNTGLATVDYLRVYLKDLPVLVEELDRSEGPGTPQWTREEMETMWSDTTPGPHWDPNSFSPYPISAISTPQWSGHEIEDMHFGANQESAWNPNASSPLPVVTTIPSPPSPNPEPDHEPLNPSEQQAAADRLEEFCLQAFREAEEEETAQAAASVPQHWILHPKLVGLRVQASVEDQDVYLDIVARGNGATAQQKVDGTNQSIHDIATVQRARDLIKPSTEKNLMVVVGGDPEHIGKLV